MKNPYRILILILGLFCFTVTSAQISRVKIKKDIKIHSGVFSRIPKKIPKALPKFEDKKQGAETNKENTETETSTDNTETKEVIEISTDREGVNLGSYEDLSILLSVGKYQSFLEKLNISRDIYQDTNTHSNYYYYLPATYTLKWDKDSGKYAFNIFYLSSQNSENTEVLIKVELVSKISKEDLEMATFFLRKELGNDKLELMPLPIQGVGIDFGSALSNFNVKPESVSINATSDFLQPIVVEWKMESRVDDFVSAMLSGFGLNALVVFQMEDEESGFSVPLNLQISEPVTFGKLAIKSVDELENTWTNYLDFPIKLNHLIIHRKNKTEMETFDMENIEVSSGEKFTYTGLKIKSGIDELWFDYSILDCKKCKEAIKKKIIGGTSGSQITNLEIQIMDIMTTSEAYMFKLNIKSKQADPNGINEVELPSITIKEDDMSIAGGKYYVPENEKLLYKYQLIQIMPDGTTKTSPWKRGDKSFLVIGASQLETIFEKNIEDSEAFNIVKDSVLNRGKGILENLFKKKDD